MKYFYVVCAVIAIFSCCYFQGDRTDAEIFEVANEVYKDYLFEYGIDNALFSSFNMEARQDGQKRYKWIAIGSKGDMVGVEVIVSKKKNIKPEMILIGDTDAWIPFVGSKTKRGEKGGR